MQPIKNLGYLLHHLSSVLDYQSDYVLQQRLPIGFSQFKILMVLKGHANARQREIAELLAQTEASVSRQVKLLIKQGLIRSTVVPSNRREHIISLTSKGLNVAENAIETLNEYHGPVFAKLSSQQQDQLLGLLNIMHSETCRGSKPGTCH